METRWGQIKRQFQELDEAGYFDNCKEDTPAKRAAAAAGAVDSDAPTKCGLKTNSTVDGDVLTKRTRKTKSTVDGDTPAKRARKTKSAAKKAKYEAFISIRSSSSSADKMRTTRGDAGASPKVGDLVEGYKMPVTTWNFKMEPAMFSVGPTTPKIKRDVVPDVKTECKMEPGEFLPGAKDGLYDSD